MNLSRKISIGIVLVFIYVAYELNVPEKLYFSCYSNVDSSTWTEYEDGHTVDDYGERSVDLKVKRYFLGLKYAINDFKVQECNMMREDELACFAGDDYVRLDMVTGKMFSKTVFGGGSKTKNKYKLDWQCESKKPLIK